MSPEKTSVPANLNHAIRASTDSIVSITEVLIETSLTESQKNHLLTIQHSARALVYLFNDVLSLLDVKKESPKNKGTPVSVELQNGGNPLPETQKSFGTHVLLVEDNEINQKTAMAMLNKFGCTFDLAKNGKEAVEWVKKKNYGLILMDIQMPEMDGIQATKEIRKLLRWHPTIIAMTANALYSSQQECLAAGVDDVLLKPVSLNALCNTLEKFASQDTSAVHIMQEMPTPSFPPPSSNPTTQPPILNPIPILEVSGNDPIIINQFIDTFNEQMPLQMGDLKDSLKKGDWESVKAHAHKIKGSVSYFGAERLIHRMKQIESAIKENNVFDCPNLIEQSFKDFEDVKDAIKKIDWNSYKPNRG